LISWLFSRRTANRYFIYGWLCNSHYGELSKNGDQKERITSYAGNALPVFGMIFAAGIFTGISKWLGKNLVICRGPF
jgi:Mg2+/citrate symporter